MSVQIGFIGGAYWDVENEYEDIARWVTGGGAPFEVTLVNGQYGRLGDEMRMLVNPSAVAFVRNHNPKPVSA